MLTWNIKILEFKHFKKFPFLTFHTFKFLLMILTNLNIIFSQKIKSNNLSFFSNPNHTEILNISQYNFIDTNKNSSLLINNNLISLYKNSILDNLESNNFQLNKSENPQYSKILNYNPLALTQSQYSNSKEKKISNLFISLPIFFSFLNKNTFVNNYLRKINHNSTSPDPDVDNNFFNILVDYLKEIFKEIFEKTNAETPFSQTCRDNLTEAYLNNSTFRNESLFFYLKGIIDSTKNKNDVGSFQDCINNGYYNFKTNLNLLEYIVVDIHQNKNINKKVTDDDFNFVDENGKYVIGICFRKGCKNDELKNLFKNIFYEIGMFQNSTSYDMELFILDSQNLEFKKEDYIKLIPIYFLLIQIMFYIFPSVPAKLFSWMLKKNRITPTNSNNISKKNNELSENEHENKKDKNIIDEQNQNEPNNLESYNETRDSNKNSNNFQEIKKNKKIIENFFSILKNIQDLFLINFNKENIKPLYDFSSLGYIVGIRGIAMISIIIGYVFLILYESPVKIYTDSSYFNLTKSFFFIFISSGLRLSPKILFACSGYCLCYKILNYFDKKMRIINDGGSEDRFFDEQNYENIDENNKTDDNKNINTNFEKNINNSHKLPIKYLFIFIFKQTNKYFIFIFFLLIFKYSLYTLISCFGQVGPMWEYFKINIINNLTTTNLIYYIFYCDNIWNFESKGHIDSNGNKDSEKNFINLFYLISLEIKFFLITSVIIYIAFKRNNRMDIFIFFFIIISIIGKIILFFLLNLKNSDISDDDNLYYPTLFFKINKYNIISNTFYYNFSFYLIGVIYGSVNFIRQKSLNMEDLKTTGKCYLILPLKIHDYLNFLFHYKKYIFNFVIFVSFTICLLISSSPWLFMILNDIKNSDQLNQHIRNIAVNIYYSIDGEIFMFLFLFFLSAMSRYDGNVFLNILKMNYWVFKNKIYFGYILMMNSVICYVFYQSESRIKLENFNVLFLSIVCYMNLIIICFFYYVLIDVPFKKFNKYILQEK